MLFELAKAAAILLALFGGWLAVQVAWRHVFPEISNDVDPLGERDAATGCQSCDHSGGCSMVTGTAGTSH